MGEVLSLEERKKFPPLVPDFVIERSEGSDRLKPLQDKMQEYLDNGVLLGWLINPQDKHVEIYRQNQAVEVVNIPVKLSGEDVLVRFELRL